MGEQARLLVVTDEWKPMEALAEFLRGEGQYSVECVAQSGPDPDLGQFEAVFVYVHSIMEAHVEEALIDYVLDGGRLIVFHHTIASAKVANPDWLRFVGIHIAPRDDPHYPWLVVQGTHTLVNLAPGHYITTHGVDYDRMIEYRSSDAPSVSSAYPALDLPETEVFLNQHFADGRAKTVLFGFRVTHPETGKVIMQDRSGWYKPAGKGWLFYLQPGHAASDFRHRAFGQIILNCLHWKPDRALTTVPVVQEAVREPGLPTSVEYYALESDPEGWVDITPGPDLTGWQEYPWPPGDAPTEAFRRKPPQWHADAERGVLLCDGRTHAHLLTERVYRDFCLHVEWRFVDRDRIGHNSGVFVRMLPGQRVMHQVETRYGKVGVVMGSVLADGELRCLGVAKPGKGGRWRAVWPHVPRAWAAHIVHRGQTPRTEVPESFGASAPVAVHGPGEWNTYEITCTGSRIVVRTNGLVSSIADNCRVPEGAVGFESEGYAIEFRNIKLKELG